MSVDQWSTVVRESIAAMESVFTMAALAVGAWWFFVKRTPKPVANITHDVKMWRDADRIFIHLAVRITNCGSVLMQIKSGCAWVEQLQPIPENTQRNLAAGDFVPAGRVEAEWSLLQQRDLPKNFLQEIEPGETDQIDFDFCIESNVRRVLIYSNLPNVKEKSRGWNLNTLCETPANSHHD